MKENKLTMGDVLMEFDSYQKELERKKYENFLNNRYKEK